MYHIKMYYYLKLFYIKKLCKVYDQIGDSQKHGIALNSQAV